MIHKGVSSGPSIPAITQVPDWLGKLIGGANPSGHHSMFSCQGGAHPVGSPAPWPQASSFCNRQVLVSYLQVSNPMLRAFSIWAMVGRVLLKALQRSAASVREMLYRSFFSTWYIPAYRQVIFKSVGWNRGVRFFGINNLGSVRSSL